MVYPASASGLLSNVNKFPFLLLSKTKTTSKFDRKFLTYPIYNHTIHAYMQDQTNKQTDQWHKLTHRIDISVLPLTTSLTCTWVLTYSLILVKSGALIQHSYLMPHLWVTLSEVCHTDNAKIQHRWLLLKSSDFYRCMEVILARCPSCRHQWLTWVSVGAEPRLALSKSIALTTEPQLLLKFITDKWCKNCTLSKSRLRAFFSSSTIVSRSLYTSCIWREDRLPGDSVAIWHTSSSCENTHCLFSSR